MNNDEKLLTPAALAIFNIAKEAALINEIYKELKECSKLFEDEEIKKYFDDKKIDKSFLKRFFLLLIYL